ncbi:MAG TPA: ABC transporter ATP-binding protein [Acidimicrobiales bacterium]|nr:ABC transporter ATP-binding protein [Acidimicrobiales bacterium]
MTTGPTVERLLTVDRIAAGYKRSAVIRDVSLHVDAGEVVALLGPNGAGKTTTLLTISALLPLMAGSIELFGKRLASQSPHELARAGLAHVPEDRALFFDLTVREHLRIAAKQGNSHPDVAFDSFPTLARLSKRRAGLLSGGEQQMLALGRALVLKPKLLIVDEMSMGLAPVIVEQLLPSLRSIADERGCGVLMVEQHVHLALEVADRAYVLSHGDLVLEGNAADLRDDSALLESSYLGVAAVD